MDGISPYLTYVQVINYNNFYRWRKVDDLETNFSADDNVSEVCDHTNVYQCCKTLIN